MSSTCIAQRRPLEVPLDIGKDQFFTHAYSMLGNFQALNASTAVEPIDIPMEMADFAQSPAFRIAGAIVIVVVIVFFIHCVVPLSSG